MTTPSAPGTLAAAVAPETSRRALSFDQKIVAVTAIPFAAFLVIHLIGTLPLTLGVLTLILGGPHVLATFGLYSDREILALSKTDPRRYLIIPALALPVSAVAFGVVGADQARWLLTAFLIWQTHHFTKQNLGMFAFWCRARGIDGMAPDERKLILSTTLIGSVGVVRAMDLLPRFDLPFKYLGLALILIGLAQAARSGRSARTLALGAAVIFYAPLFLFNVNLLEASFAYQAAHGAQYYLMVGHTIRSDRRAIRFTIPVVLVGGIVLLSITSSSIMWSTPWLFGLGKGIIAAHFIADASLWRLRDPGVRAIMKRRFAFL